MTTYNNYRDHIKGLEQKFNNIEMPGPITKKTNMNLGLRVNIEAEYDENIAEELKKFAETEIEKSLEDSFEKIKEPLTQALNEAMQASWGWEGGSRDIINTGELMNSLKIEINGKNISITYDSPYAMLVHYGGYIMPYGNSSIEKVFIPGRPWVDAVLNGGGPVPQFKFEDYIEIE
jgi:phage gpG-like protein